MRTFNAHFYVREYGNRTRWFPAFGAEFSDIRLGGRFVVSAAVHGWRQPERLSFTATKGRTGAAIDAMCKFRLNKSDAGGVGISADLRVVAKTEGFLLEYMAMDRHVGVRFGTSLWFLG